jgi:hypothetical protein
MDPNAVRFDPAARRDHVESYFIKVNEPNGDRAVWLKATIFASAREPSRTIAEGWAIAFDRRGGRMRHAAVKHTLPYASTSFSREALGVRWELPQVAAPRTATSPDATASEAPQALDTPDSMLINPGATRGAISHRGERVAWDLRFSGSLAPIAPLPFEAMYKPTFPSAKLVTPYPDLRFEGTVTAFGETWSLDGWRGMQGHNWGRRHTDFYAWCHINVWEEEEDFILEGMSASVRLGPLQTPLLTLICARHRGVRYDFNRPIDMARAKGDATLRRWTFSTSGKYGRIEGEVEAETDAMVGLYYANPAGPMTYCLNSKLSRARVRFEAQGRPPLVLTSKAAALEIGTHDADHGVQMAV